MTKFVSLVLTLVVGAVTLAVAAPALARLASALTAPIVAGGIVACLVRIVWAATRRW